MAQPANNSNNYAFRKRAAVKKAVLHQLRIDMTPMVDLGFLLISFFVITTELSQPRSMNLNVPKDRHLSSELGESYALTVIAGKDDHYYYHGDWEKAKRKGELISFSTVIELRKIITAKQKKLDDRSVYKEGREGLMVLLKPSEHTNYRTVIDILDELLITNVKKHAIVKLSGEEKNWLEGAR